MAPASNARALTFAIALVPLASMVACQAPGTITGDTAPLQPSADTNTTARRSTATPLSKPGTADYSGYLSDYGDLAPIPGRPGTLSFRDPALARYRSFIIEPVAVLTTRTIGGSEVSELTRRQLALDLRDEVQETLRQAGKLAPVHQSGPGVATIRAAVTELARTVTPGLRRDGQLGGATVEAEVIDSETGARLGTIVISESVAESDESVANPDVFRDVRIVFSSWAARLNKWLDE